ncbi:SurA N-terminal domain-containing protein [Terriglobus tenax]|uniref:SurA N-terminal domain-containing protein n=1 Tax=Terriglobus tenax TaxID=1111115 RepID=UPI0021E067F0|nr:SurA N-terminal domain-containing protein [Terriglobus tenax]
MPGLTKQHTLTGLLLLSLTVAGCNRQPAADVVATVNGKPIAKSDLEKYYKGQLGDQQQTPSQEQADSMRLNVLRSLIDEEILQQRAAKMNLTATNEEVDAKVAEMKAPVTEEQFNQHLKDSGLTLDDLKRDVRRSLTTEKLLNKEINSRINVTDGDVSSYYNQHKNEYNLIETQYHLAQIIVTSQPAQQPQQISNLQASKANNDGEAQKKIQALKNRLDSGEDFGTLAMNFSESPQTAPNGGDMGFFSESQLRSDTELFNSISKLKPGQVTAVIPVPEGPGSKRAVGYAIFKLVSREPAGQRSLNDPAVQQAIRQQLKDGRSQLLKNAYFEMLRDEAKVKNYFAETVFKNEAK